MPRKNRKNMWHIIIEELMKRKEKIREQVIVLLPDSSNEFLSRWQGPGLVVDFKPPHTHLIELEGEQ